MESPGRSLVFRVAFVLAVIISIIASYLALQTFGIIPGQSETVNIVVQNNIFPIPPEIPDPVLLQQWKAHNQNCNHTITVYITVGLGSYSIRCLLMAVHYALRFNRTLFLAPSKPNDLKWETFFEPVSPPHCKLPPPAINKGGGTLLGEDTKPSDLVNVDHVWLEALFCPLWKNHYLFMEEGKEGDLMFKAIPLVFKINKIMTSEIEKVLSVFPNWSKRTFHAIHIRRGDKVFGPYAEAKYQPTEEYCKGLEIYAGKNITDPVFIAADSVSSIEEVKKERKNWTVWSISVPRYDELREGNFSHKEMFKWPEDDRTLFYKMFLAEIVMMRFAKNFVGTGTSNVWQLLHVMRNGKLTTTIN